MILAAIFVMGDSALAGHPSVWIKDCAADDGSVPSGTNCPHWWTSPDIWIDNDGDQKIDSPVHGQENTLKARFRSKYYWPLIHWVQVDFYYRDNTTGPLMFPDGATLIGSDIVMMMGVPDDYGVASVKWKIPKPPASGGHWCIGAVVTLKNDGPKVPAVLPPEDKNVAMANLWWIAQEAGKDAYLDFTASASANQEGEQTFVLEVTDELPVGWKWRLSNVEPGEPFDLRPGENRRVKLRVKPPRGAQARERGRITVSQVHVDNKRTVGGVTFNIYEDHLAPNAVRILDAEIVRSRPVLTWEKSQTEAETGFVERIAYYEVSRNGKRVASVNGDEDARRHGVQWVDRAALGGRNVYTVRAVDEGGNVSDESPEAAVVMMSRAKSKRRGAAKE